MRTLPILALSVGALVTLCAAPAAAQSYSTHRFDPAPAGDSLFGIQSPITSGARDEDFQIHGGLLFDYAYNPVTLNSELGTEDRRSIVSDQAFLHIAASITFWDRVTVGFIAPTALYQAGTSYFVDGDLYEAPEGPAFGDIRINAKGAIYGELHGPFQFGVASYIYAPTGERDSFVGEGSAHGGVEALLGGELSRFYWNLTVGPHLREKDRLAGTALGPSVGFGMAAGALLGERKQVQIGPETKISVTPSETSSRNTFAELLLGAKYRFAENYVLGAAGGPGLTQGFGTPDVRMVFSFMYTPDAHRDRACPMTTPVDSRAAGDSQ